MAGYDSPKSNSAVIQPILFREQGDKATQHQSWKCPCAEIRDLQNLPVRRSSPPLDVC